MQAAGRKREGHCCWCASAKAVPLKSAVEDDSSRGFARDMQKCMEMNP